VTETSGREEILRRIRQALTDTPPGTPDTTTLTRDYLTAHADRTPRQTTDLLAEHLTDYRAHVHRTTPTDLPTTIARILTDHGTRTAVVPPGLPQHWLTDLTDIHLTPATTELTARQLDTTDTVITACALAIAETGTIVLDAGPDQGQRRITLIPDHHLCIVHAPEQIVDSVPQAHPPRDPPPPPTRLNGPTPTSDIELDRVEGVHGPRTLDVIIVWDPA
jgi:L-lactate dehydrogenase complex protein LldG